MAEVGLEPQLLHPRMNSEASLLFSVFFCHILYLPLSKMIEDVLNKTLPKSMEILSNELRSKSSEMLIKRETKN